jgi:hypothetical protein
MNEVNYRSAGEEDIAAARLSLMKRLQASLAGSHLALLTLDLAGMEKATSEQASLARDLRMLLVRAEAGHQNPGKRNQRLKRPGVKPERMSELGRSESCVLQALRLHSALLRRAQYRLRVITNTLAGPTSDYSPLMRKGSPSIKGLDWKCPG